MKYLVTGSTGHLGANLVRRLLHDGHAVRVLLRPRSDATALQGLNVERALGDVREADSIRTAVSGCDGVYHCAAMVSILTGSATHCREVFDTNVVGTRHVLQAAHEASVPRVVVSGSFSATGDNPNGPSDEGQPFYPFGPQAPYTVSKVMVEHECLRAAAAGLNVVIATSTAIVGPWDFKPSRLGQALVDFAHGRLHAYVGGGFTFVAADDIVAGHVLAMEKGRPGQKYIFASEFLTMDALLDLFARATGQPRPWLRLPGGLMAAAAEVADRVWPAEPRRFTPASVRFMRSCRRADCRKAQSELGYQPSRIAPAVQAALDCFVRRGVISTTLQASTVTS